MKEKIENFFVNNRKEKIIIGIAILLILLLLIIGLVVANNSSTLEDYDMSDVTFEDSTVTYDGTEHSLEIEGNLPDGVTVSYEYDGASLDGETDAGTYTVVASFTGDTTEYNTISDMTATLTIEQASLSTVFSLGDSTVTYDGNEHSLEVSGDIPDGVSVSYKYNNESATGETDAGTYNVVATITNTSSDYAEASLELEATLTINQATLDLSGVTLEGASVTYDGNAHSLAVSNLPDNASVSYTYNNKDVASVTDAGTYDVVATVTVTSSNYVESSIVLEKTLIIEQAEIDATFSDLTVTYDGSLHSITASDVLDGASVSYKYDGNNVTGETNAGTYTVEATFTIDDANYKTTTKSVTLTIEQASIDLSDVIFKGYNVDFDNTEHSVTASNLPDGVEVTYTYNGNDVTSETAGGVYTVEATFTINDANYKDTTLSVTLTINNTDMSDYTYTLYSQTSKICLDKYKGSDSDVVLPEVVSIDGVIYSVFEISSSIFASDTSLISIEISSGITLISSNAFSGCTNLETVTFDGNVTTLSTGCFQNCSSLESITIPSSVTSLGYWVFKNCSKLESIEIPAKVKSIAASTFYDCTNLSSVTFDGDIITSIGAAAFSGCGFSSITLPSSLKTLSDSVFSGCTSLYSIEIPSGVTTIGSTCFSMCKALTEITIPSNVESLGDNCFAYCSGLKNMTIGSSVKSIGSQCFISCTSLLTITISSSVTSIGSYCLSHCSSLTNVIFEDTTSSWYVSKTEGGTDNTVSVSDSEDNVTYFSSTYVNYYWTKISD